jgi:6-phosphogluconolactonase (cycloisomerase 2 family)
MRRHALGTPSLFVLLAVCFFLTGCGTSSHACPGVSGASCGCGPSGSACPIDALQLLYATTTSNQIMGFSISSSGALTALPSTTGPASFEGVAVNGNAVMLTDTVTNSIDSVFANLVTGALTPVQGSPFSLGTPDGGPAGIVVGPNFYFYATEPNGTIVGFGTGGEVGSLGSELPGSPYAAGVAPSQMALAANGNSGTSFLYASDPGDSNGGILAYSLDSTGSLTQLQNSPFPTLPGANPSFILSGSYAPAFGSPGTPFLLVSLTNAAKVGVFAIDSNTGALTPAPGSPFSAGNSPGTILEDDSNHVFVVNAGDHTVSAFNLASNGVLTAIGPPVAVGTASGGMAYFPGNQLYVADATSSEIWTLNVNSTTGQLSQTGPPLMVPSPPVQLAYLAP